MLLDYFRLPKDNFYRVETKFAGGHKSIGGVASPTPPVSPSLSLHEVRYKQLAQGSPRREFLKNAFFTNAITFRIKDKGVNVCQMRFGNLMHFGPGTQTHDSFGYAKMHPTV